MNKQEFEQVFAETAEKSGVAEMARDYQFAENLEAMMCELRDKLNSLPAEQPSEDLKKAAEEYASMSQIAYKGIHCTYVDDQHAFIAGADWQKERLIKNAFLWLQHNAEKYVNSYSFPNYQTGLLLYDFKHAMEDKQ